MLRGMEKYEGMAVVMNDEKDRGRGAVRTAMLTMVATRTAM